MSHIKQFTKNKIINMIKYVSILIAFVLPFYSLCQSRGIYEMVNYEAPGCECSPEDVDIANNFYIKYLNKKHGIDAKENFIDPSDFISLYIYGQNRKRSFLAFLVCETEVSSLAIIEYKVSAKAPNSAIYIRKKIVDLKRINNIEKEQEQGDTIKMLKTEYMSRDHLNSFLFNLKVQFWIQKNENKLELTSTSVGYKSNPLRMRELALAMNKYLYNNDIGYLSTIYKVIGIKEIVKPDLGFPFSPKHQKNLLRKRKKLKKYYENKPFSYSILKVAFNLAMIEMLSNSSIKKEYIERTINYWKEFLWLFNNVSPSKKERKIWKRIKFEYEDIILRLNDRIQIMMDNEDKLTDINSNIDATNYDKARRLCLSILQEGGDQSKEALELLIKIENNYSRLINYADSLMDVQNQNAAKDMYHKVQGAYPLSYHSHIKIDEINFNMTSSNSKDKKASNQEKVRLKTAIAKDVDFMIKNIFSDGVDNSFYNIDLKRKKVVTNAIIKGNNLVMTIDFIRNNDSYKTTLQLESNFSAGKYTHSEEQKENNVIVDAVLRIDDHLKKMNANSKLRIIYSGGADNIPSQRTIPITAPYENLREAVIYKCPCQNVCLNEVAKFSSFNRSSASGDDRNWCLAYMRAYKRKVDIQNQLSKFKLKVNSDVCAIVHKEKGAGYRYVDISIEITVKNYNDMFRYPEEPKK